MSGDRRALGYPLRSSILQSWVPWELSRPFHKQSWLLGSQLTMHISEPMQNEW